MVGTLVFDAVRRSLGMFCTLGVLAMLSGSLIAMNGAWTASAMAVSMTTAFVLGPAIALGLLAPREVLGLPVSRRKVWQAQWVLGTLVAPLWNTMAKLLGAAIAGLFAPIGVEQMALSALCDVAYCGAFFGVIPLLNVSPRGGWILRKALPSALYALVILVFVGGVAWGFVVQRLPADRVGHTGRSRRNRDHRRAHADDCRLSAFAPRRREKQQPAAGRSAPRCASGAARGNSRQRAHGHAADRLPRGAPGSGDRRRRPRRSVRD